MTFRIYYTKAQQNRIGQVVLVDNPAAVADVVDAFEKSDRVDAYSVFGLTGMRLSPSDLQLTAEFSKWSKKP